ncbi:MAG: NUDIX hydrolase [Desulfonauticus sp.]|nr:NUDIX hydrolase [Desulfonauticus sp.]
MDQDINLYPQLEVVDKQNHLLALMIEPLVHSQGLYHRSVAVLTFSKDQKLILIKRQNPNKPFCNYYDLPYTHLQAGKSYYETASNLIYDQFNIRPNNLHFIDIVSPKKNPFQEFIYLYKCILNLNSNSILNSKHTCIEQKIDSSLPFTPLVITLHEHNYLF